MKVGGVKRPSVDEGGGGAVKRPRLDPPRRWADYVQSNDAVVGLTRYAQSVLHGIRERDKMKFQLEQLPGSIDLVFDAVCHFIGEVWKFCVELSRVRIDVAVHELWRDYIEEDLTPMYFLESLNAYDEQERAKITSATSGHDLAMSRAQDDSDVNRSPLGRKKKKRPATAEGASVVTGTPDIGTVGSPVIGAQSSALLFGNTEPGGTPQTAASPEEKAREASLVQRKQAELGRQVEVDDVRAALMLCAEDDYVITCPPRIRRTFAHLSCMYYEPFMERIAAMRAQGLSSGAQAVPPAGHMPHVQMAQRPMMMPPHVQPQPSHLQMRRP